MASERSLSRTGKRHLAKPLMRHSEYFAERGFLLTSSLRSCYTVVCQLVIVVFECNMNRSALLNTDTEDLKELLSNGKSYHVPPYQRDYSWKTEHWEDLWEDLIAVADGQQDHYMGAVVLESTERKSYRIIDGQQRMATLTIVILACTEALHNLAERNIDTAANRERAAELERSYLGTKDPASLRIAPKLRLNDNDDDFFQLNVVQRRPPVAGTRNLRDSERLLWECVQFFRKKVSDRFMPGERGEAIAEFVNEAVTERLVFITVRVQDQLSAYTVFETLNARGLELTETDLLKNYLLSLADRLSKSQMEPLLKQWSRITSLVGAARFPEFLRQHLNSRQSYVRQKQLFKTIRNDISGLDQVFGLLDRLETDAVWFDALNDYNSEFWLDYQGAREHVRVLNLFGVSQYTPLILSAKDCLPRHEIAEILKYCAVVSVRFNGVSRRSTHLLEEVYNQAALQLRQNEKPSTTLVRKSLKPIYIPDTEFTDAFSSLQMKNRGIAGKRLRYFLAKIEHQLSGTDIIDEVVKATVEHILPESLSDSEWPQFSTTVHERCVEKLGNYSLLERSLNNKDAANASFPTKKVVFERSPYQISRQLCDCDDWNETSIQDRQRQFARVGKAIWSFQVD